MTVLILLALLVMIVYPFVEARYLTVEKVVLKSDDLPANANHLRIVFLSDIHWGFWYSDSNLRGLVTKINSLRPDLVIFGGDYATDHESALQFFRRLQDMRIHARYGIYGVPGETDRGEDDQDRTLLSEAMSNGGVTPLFNRVEYVTIGSGRICIAGVDDALAGKPDLQSVADSVSSKDYVILVAHNPSLITEIQQTRDSSGNLSWFDLGLFGHTHAGQMAFFSTALNIAEDVPDRYRSGWLKENRVDLLISPGIGTSVFPGRLFCFPTIHCITLTY